MNRLLSLDVVRVVRSSLVAALAAALTLVPAVALALARVGEPAPAFSAPGLAGKPVSLAALRGKAVYVNFFANWCPPCNQEAPDIARLARKYASKGLAVVGVDELESAAKAREFSDKYKLGYLIALDESGAIGRDYGVAVGLPVHAFVDRRGRVTAIRYGEMSPAEIESAIKTALK